MDKPRVIVCTGLSNADFIADLGFDKVYSGGLSVDLSPWDKERESFHEYKDRVLPCFDKILEEAWLKKLSVLVVVDKQTLKLMKAWEHATYDPNYSVDMATFGKNDLATGDSFTVSLGMYYFGQGR